MERKGEREKESPNRLSAVHFSFLLHDVIQLSNVGTRWVWRKSKSNININIYTHPRGSPTFIKIKTPTAYNNKKGKLEIIIQTQSRPFFHTRFLGGYHFLSWHFVSDFKPKDNIERKRIQTWQSVQTLDKKPKSTFYQRCLPSSGWHGTYSCVSSHDACTVHLQQP